MRMSSFARSLRKSEPGCASGSDSSSLSRVLDPASEARAACQRIDHLLTPPLVVPPENEQNVLLLMIELTKALQVAEEQLRNAGIQQGELQKMRALPAPPYRSIETRPN